MNLALAFCFLSVLNFCTCGPPKGAVKEWYPDLKNVAWPTGSVALDCYTYQRNIRLDCRKDLKSGKYTVAIMLNNKVVELLKVENCNSKSIHDSIWYIKVASVQLTMVYFMKDGKCYQREYEISGSEVIRKDPTNITKKTGPNDKDSCGMVPREYINQCSQKMNR